jgi:hypothetical protein
MVVSLNTSWPKITKMNERQEQERTFITAVCAWLTNMGVSVLRHDHGRFTTLKAGSKTVVLDLMHLPYRKPEQPGYVFSLDHFLFHSVALKSRLMSIFGKTATVFARNCNAQRITKQEAEPFFSLHHLSGYANAKFKYGLFHNRQLLAAITFAQGRNLKTENGLLRSYEWVGFCQQAGITVTGGLSKLIKTFCRDKHPDHIATYVDRAWANGGAMKKLGFSATDELPPLHFSIDWTTGLRTFPSRSSRQQHAIDKAAFPYRNSGYLKFEQFYKVN